MQILIFREKGNKSSTIRINGWVGILVITILLASCTLIIGASSYFYGVKIGYKSLSNESITDLNFLKNQYNSLQGNYEAKKDFYARKLALIQSELTRLNSLGNKIARIANLDRKKFNFDSPAFIGGTKGVDYKKDFFSQLDEVFEEILVEIDSTHDQLNILNKIIDEIQIKEQFKPTGKPVLKGQISSMYGYRNKVFGGKGKDFHKGIDLAGKTGNKIFTLASGRVSFSGFKKGYGYIVEIDHGNGWKTRYAHNSKNVVEYGEFVKKGSLIALMGDTGHSTGPHVHLEILKNGKAIDPYKYIISKDKFFNKKIFSEQFE